MPSPKPPQVCLIDPPTPFDGIEEWRAHLAELEASAARTDRPPPEIVRAIKEAREFIATLKTR